MTLPMELDHVVIFTHVDAPEAQALGIKELTGVRIPVRSEALSPVAGIQGKTLDVRPTLPLVLAS